MKETGMVTEEHKKNMISPEEVERFLEDREKIRKIVGSIGGKPTRHERVINIIFFIVVAIIFIIALLPFPVSKFLTMEIAILLVSFKLIYFMHNEAKLNHFEFWVLSTIEWKMNKVSKSLLDVNKSLRSLEKKIEGNTPDIE
jgi:hypothetical protein